MRTNVYRYFSLTMLSILISVSPALATHPANKAEIDNIKQRIEALESGTLGEAEEEPSFSLFAGNKHLTFSGVLELEANYADTGGMNSSSDLNLSSFQFSTEVVINDSIGGHVILLYEEPSASDSLNVDEAVISLTSPKLFLGQSLAFHGGKLYLPFSKSNSYMLTDPLSHDLGETGDTAGLFILSGDLWSLSIGGFNGGVDAVGDEDQIDSLVVSLELTPMENISFGVSWINDLAESDAELVADPSLYSSNVAGAAAFISMNFGPLDFEGEILGALDDFDTTLVGLASPDLTGPRPWVWSLEAAWMPTNSLQLAGRYEKSKDFQDDVERYGATCSYGLFSHTVLALEYLHSSSENDLDIDNLTAQLALEF